MKSLKSILNELENEELKMLIEEDIDFKTKKETVEYLEEEIKEKFINFMDNEFDLDYLEVINNIKKDKNDNSFLSDELIDQSFVFFEDDDTLLFPKELDDIFKEKFDKEFQIKLLESIITGYVVINNLVPISFIEENYIKKYHLDIKITDLDLDLDYTIKDDLILAIDDEQYLKMYSELKDIYSYRLLSYQELIDEHNNRKEILDELNKIIKDESVSSNLYMFLTLSPIKDPENFSLELKDYSLSKKQLSKIEEMYFEHVNEIRFSAYLGRNINDLLLDSLKEEAIEVKDINDFKVKDLIENSPIFSKFAFSKEYFLESYKNLSQFDLVDIYCGDQNEVDYDNFPVEMVSLGYFGIVKLNGKYCYLMPKELREIVDKQSEDRKYLFTKYDDFDDIEQMICEYVNINGIIKREKILELMDEYQIDANDLDKILDSCELMYDENYVYLYEFESDEIKYLEENKKDKEYYKIESIEELGDLVELEDIRLLEILSEHIGNFDCLDKHILLDIQLNRFNKKSLKEQLKEHDIYLNNKNIETLYEEINSIIDDIPMWINNGYSNDELND